MSRTTTPAAAQETDADTGTDDADEAPGSGRRAKRRARGTRVATLARPCLIGAAVLAVAGQFLPH